MRKDMLTAESGRRPAASFRRRLFLVLQWGISLLALGYALYGVDARVLWQAVQDYTLPAMLAAAGVVALDYACMGLRLRWLLPPGTSYGLSLRAVLLCVGYNNILPAKAGDAIKVLFLSRKTGCSVLQTGSVVLWERLLDVLSLLLVALLAYALGHTGQRLLLPACLVLAGASLFFVLRHWSAWFHAAYARLFPGRVAALCSRLHTSLVDEVSPLWVARGFLCSLLIWTCYCASFWVVFCLVADMPLHVMQVLSVFAVTCLGMAVPSSPGGLGVFEGAVVLGLSWCGVEQSEALGAALFLHALHFIPQALAAVIINGRRDCWQAEGCKAPGGKDSCAP